MKSRILTRDKPLCLFLLSPCGFLKRGQGVLLLLKGSLCVLDRRFLLTEGHVLLSVGRGERGDSRLLALEFGILVLELGLLRLEGLFLLLKRRSSSLQDPRNTATSSAGDGTLYRSHHATRWSCQDAGVISARPRTTPRTTATPGAMLFSAPECTFYSSHPLRTPDSGRR